MSSFFGMRRASTGSSKHSSKVWRRSSNGELSSTKMEFESERGNDPRDKVQSSCADPMPVLRETSEEKFGVLKRMSNDMETGKQDDGSSDLWINNPCHDNKAAVSVLNAANGTSEDFQLPSDQHEEGSENFTQ